ncbi:Long-chain-fatty-acid--CoA ligase [bacterium HR30]|nr:Long-chain-fatty-acid--CoA ligase [bacterium HR30]
MVPRTDGPALPATRTTLGGAFPLDSEAPALLAANASYSFRDLASRSASAALTLAQLGVRKGTHVGLLLPNGPDWIALAWAVWRLGGVLVPLNTLWSARELIRAIDLADVHLLVATPCFLKNDYARLLDSAGVGLTRYDAQANFLPCLRTIVWLPHAPQPNALSWQQCFSSAVSERQLQWLESMEEQTTKADVAAIFFTSGSEAEPKAVVHTHGSMLAAARGIAERLGLDTSDRVWAYLPWFFAGGLVAGVIAPWIVGAAVICQEVFDAGQAIALMERYRATTFFAWPHQAQAIVQHPNFARGRIPLHKGTGAQADWANALYQPGHRAVSTWGMTETGPMVCATAWSDPIEKRQTTHGRPLPGVEMKVVDPDSGEQLPPGDEGELLVRGPTLMRGYYKQPRRTCFDDTGFFRTGDRAWIDDEGYLHFVGRMRDVIKTAGASVSPAEVEAVVSAHPVVRTAVVVGVPDLQRGQCVVAFVVPRQQTPLDEAQLTAWCRERLAAYKVPKHFFLLAEHELPVLGSGKVDKARLVQRAQELLVSWRST